MKVIIAGCRHFGHPADYELVEAAVRESGFEITEVVSGRARGIDRWASTYATRNRIPCRPFYAQWHMHGQVAGMVRNQAMADYADALIAVWDNRSRGTADMIDRARKQGLKVYVYDAEL